MSRRIQIVLLVLLFVVLGGGLYSEFAPSDNPGTSATNVNAPFAPVDVDNPALRTDILQRFLNIEYKGVHRNIFSATLPPPPPPPKPLTPPVIVPVAPAGPPPLNVNAKYFGYVSDGQGSGRRGFFASNNNEDVIIAGEGDTILGRFRIVRLTTTAADVEEVSSGQRATLAIEPSPPNG